MIRKYGWRAQAAKNTRTMRTEAEVAVPKCSNSGRKNDEKSVEYRRKSSPNRFKIHEKSILGGFGFSKPFQGHVQTRSGRLADAQRPPQGRSWDALGGPSAPKRRPKATMGRLPEAPGPAWRRVRARSEHRTPSSALAVRLFVDFVLSRGSSDV